MAHIDTYIDEFKTYKYMHNYNIRSGEIGIASDFPRARGPPDSMRAREKSPADLPSNNTLKSGFRV